MGPPSHTLAHYSCIDSYEVSQRRTGRLPGGDGTPITLGDIGSKSSAVDRLRRLQDVWSQGSIAHMELVGAIDQLATDWK